jgi:CxxC motif-containing protein (DUF1111 family)
MGITNPLERNQAERPDITQETLEETNFYNQTLAFPVARNMNDPVVRRGKALFNGANCAACHISTLTTGRSSIAALSHKTIHPYTDLLLHDMGSGLADGRPDFAATGTEWRTAPLWGVGLAQQVSPTVGFLHDGRARTLEEAILWHGGEAKQSRDRFVQMSKTDREALLKFLKAI